MALFDLVKQEIHCKEGLGCLILDLSAYFPYINQVVCELSFRYKVEDGEWVDPTDYKLNHRYPNTDYRTVTKRYGRRVSRVGYPIFVNLNDVKNKLFFLELKFCLSFKFSKTEYCTVIPMHLNMSKENSVAFLEVRYMMKEKEEDNESWYLQIHEEGTIDVDHHVIEKDIYWSMFPEITRDSFGFKDIEVFPLDLSVKEETNDVLHYIKKLEADEPISLRPQSEKELLYNYD